MRQITSMEYIINWRDLDINDFFTPQMNVAERRAVIIFASFNPNGYIREKSVRLMKDIDGALPYIMLRQNDWVQQIRQAASRAFLYRLQRLSPGEMLAALPFAEKLKWSFRSSHDEYINHFLSVLSTPEHIQDLMCGLENAYVKTRKICIDALFVILSSKTKLAVERLICEPEPFLRATIFRKLNEIGQITDEAIDIFLHDKYPVNRIVAFQYLLDKNANNINEVAEKLLLDKNAAVREVAQNAIQKQTLDFDFRNFYLNNLNLYPVAAIYGLGEKGASVDTIHIEVFLDDARVGVVKSAMTSLIRLGNNKYSPIIIEMLNDNRVGIVKTARNLILKCGQQNYQRVKEIFQNTMFENVKLKCMDVLFTAPKWSSIIYMLDMMFGNEGSIKEKSLEAVRRWLLRFNKSFSLPSEMQIAEIQSLLCMLSGMLPPDIEKEILFVLPK
jgi:hypothetical protein